MKPIIIKDVFSEEQLELLKQTVRDQLEIRELRHYDAMGPDPHSKKYIKVFSSSGRLDIEQMHIPEEILRRVEDVVNQHSEVPLTAPQNSAVYAEYSGKHGTPSLGTHFDYGVSEMIFDFQLESNVSWSLGVDFDTYTLQDNEALMFNPVGQAHWRTIKHFSEDDYVRMIFFRCFRENADSLNIENLGGESHREAVEKFRLENKEA